MSIIRETRAEPGESASSLIVRTARENGLASSRVVPDVIDALVGCFHEGHDIHDFMQRCAGTPAADRVQETIAKAFCAEPGKYVGYIHRRFCPRCLADSEYWQTGWEYTFVVFCPTHRVWLEDHCFHCNSLVPFWVNPPYCPTCGNRLGSLAQGELIQDDRSEYLAGLLARSAEEHGWLPDLLDFQAPWHAEGRFSYLLLCRIVLLVGSYAAGRDGKPRKISTKTDARAVRGLITRAAHALLPWPSAFHGLLSRLHDPGKPTFAGKMSYLYKAIYGEFVVGEVDFLRREIESYLGASWNGVLSRRHRNFPVELLESQRMAPASKITASVGIPRRVLVHGIKEGRVSGTLEELPSGRVRASIRMDLFDPADPELHFVSLKEAAADLGLPERRVRELISGGVLEGRSPQGGSPWAISRAQILRLCDELSGWAAAPLSSGKPLAHVASFVPSVARAFPSFISSVLAGEIRVTLKAAADEPLFLRVHVDTKAVRRWQLSHEGFLSVPHAAELMGLKQEVAYHLYRQGLLVASARDAPYPAVTPGDIGTFQARYVLATELAATTGRSPKVLVAGMAAQGVLPVSGPGVDGGRQVVYERRKVESQLVRARPTG